MFSCRHPLFIFYRQTQTVHWNLAHRNTARDIHHLIHVCLPLLLISPFVQLIPSLFSVFHFGVFIFKHLKDHRPSIQVQSEVMVKKKKWQDESVLFVKGCMKGAKQTRRCKPQVQTITKIQARIHHGCVCGISAACSFICFTNPVSDNPSHFTPLLFP